MKKNKLKNKYAGFSLMEMVIAISVFSLIITTLTMSFVRLTGTRKKAKMVQANIELVRPVIDQLTKVFQSSVVLGNVNVGNVTKTQLFDYAQGKCIQYSWTRWSGSPFTYAIGDNSALSGEWPVCDFTNKPEIDVMPSAKIAKATITAQTYASAVTFNFITNVGDGSTFAFQTAVTPMASYANMGQ